MKNRHRVELIRDFLTACKKPVRQIDILKQTKLGYSVFRELEEKLLKSGFIKCENKVFTITEKGHRKLEQIKELLEELSERHE